jgi:hypothetical protein
MTFYIKQGNTFSTTAEANIDIKRELPVGTYIVKFHMEKGYYLEIAENLTIKGKIYGNLNPRADRIIETFRSRPRNTGVLLNGEKGSGKTLLTKRVSELLVADGVSTLIVNQQYCGDGFNTFLQSIDQPTVVVFDEFEKVYEAENQEKILTLLDGVFPSKKLFMLTVNNMTKVDQHMINRPGRLFYSVKYEGLDRDFIIEYCNDVLINKSYSVTVANLASLFRHFNFDMLQSLVEEMNRYNEAPKEALAMLNVKPDMANYADDYTVTIRIPGWDEPFNASANKNVMSLYSPITRAVEMEVWLSEAERTKWYSREERNKRAAADPETADDEEASGVYKYFTLENHQITKMDGNGGFLYLLEDGVEITLKKKPVISYDYRDLM